MISESVLRKLREGAVAASESAYCPYSKFPVGAAVLTADGEIFSGCNVENASYGLTICAERNAVFQAVASGARHMVAVVVYTPTSTPTCPCGACRQVLNEFGPAADILCTCDGPETISRKVADLLPDAFGPANLELPTKG